MPNIFKFVTLQLLRGYKWAISPMFPPACRYVPTCSEYAIEAVDRYGAFRGGLMAIWRLLRCHPFVRGGFDPVVKKYACHPEEDAFCPTKDLGAPRDLPHVVGEAKERATGAHPLATLVEAK